MNNCSVTHRLKAFTLIEVLAAMAVLVILMMALIRIFTEASAASQKANVTVTRNAAARAALAMIRDDLQGAIVDRNLAMFKEANTFDRDWGGFDRICFVTLRQNLDSSNNYAYLQVQYYVTNVVMRSAGVVYTNRVLKRATRTMETARKWGNDPFTADGKQWWNNLNDFDHTEVIDNIIRFDIWVCAESGDNLGSGNSRFGGDNPYDSSAGVIGLLRPDQPPGYIDIYLQVTSDDAMKRGALARASGQKEAAYATLYRESNVLVTRITSLMWAAERAHPISY